MGLLDFLKAKIGAENVIHVAAPVSGAYIPLEQVPDKIFAQGVLGPGCGFEPEEETVYAPADGIVTTIAETKHAVGMTTADGAELLIHIGMDTVKLNGEGFSVKVTEGQKVNEGDVLLTFDRENIQKAGYTTTSAFVVTNAAALGGAQFDTGKTYTHGEKCGKLSK